MKGTFLTQHFLCIFISLHYKSRIYKECSFGFKKKYYIVIYKIVCLSYPVWWAQYNIIDKKGFFWCFLVLLFNYILWKKIFWQIKVISLYKSSLRKDTFSLKCVQIAWISMHLIDRGHLVFFKKLFEEFLWKIRKR